MREKRLFCLWFSSEMRIPSTAPSPVSEHHLATHLIHSDAGTCSEPHSAASTAGNPPNTATGQSTASHWSHGDSSMYNSLALLQNAPPKHDLPHRGIYSQSYRSRWFSPCSCAKLLFASQVFVCGQSCLLVLLSCCCTHGENKSGLPGFARSSAGEEEPSAAPRQSLEEFGSGAEQLWLQSRNSLVKVQETARVEAAVFPDAAARLSSALGRGGGRD